MSMCQRLGMPQLLQYQFAPSDKEHTASKVFRGETQEKIRNCLLREVDAQHAAPVTLHTNGAPLQDYLWLPTHDPDEEMIQGDACVFPIDMPDPESLEYMPRLVFTVLTFCIRHGLYSPDNPSDELPTVQDVREKLMQFLKADDNNEERARSILHVFGYDDGHQVHTYYRPVVTALLDNAAQEKSLIARLPTCLGSFRTRFCGNEDGPDADLSRLDQSLLPVYLSKIAVEMIDGHAVPLSLVERLLDRARETVVMEGGGSDDNPFHINHKSCTLYFTLLRTFWKQAMLVRPQESICDALNWAKIINPFNMDDLRKVGFDRDDAFCNMDLFCSALREAVRFLELEEERLVPDDIEESAETLEWLGPLLEEEGLGGQYNVADLYRVLRERMVLLESTEDE